MAAFVALVIATVGAFFLVQTLKATTPLIAGYPAPHPSHINPVSGGVCPLRGGKHKVIMPTDFRRMRISFLLLSKADDVTVSIVDSAGTVVDTLARDRHMAINHRSWFHWNGRRADGAVVAPGDYYVQVALIHQRRTVRIANENTGQLEPIHVETKPAAIKITGVLADGHEPAIYPQSSGRPIAINFTRLGSRTPTIRVYRTDVPGRPRLVNSFPASSTRHGFWNGTLKDGRPAPQGTYLMSVTGVDRSCTKSTFPASIPPAPGSTPHAGVTVRYLAAQPPMTPVAPGSTATVDVDSRRHAYTWTLHRVGSSAVLRSGHGRAVALRVPVPGGGGGLYVLSLRWGSHRTRVPLVAGVTHGRSGGSGSGRVLVVVPALSWQGFNEVDDDGDGIPNTLTRGTPIRIERPFAHGLPAGFAAEAGLLAYLRRAGLRYSLTTDLSLISGGESLLHGYSGVVLAGSERWLPAATGSALSTWVQQGGHVLSFGVGALQRTVTVSGGEAGDPSKPHTVDALLARPGTLHRAHGSLLLVDRDRQHLLPRTAGALSGFHIYQTFGPVQAPAKLLTAIGVSPSAPAVIGYALGRGSVVDVGLPGFGSKVGHDVTAQELVGRAWKLLQR